MIQCKQAAVEMFLEEQGQKVSFWSLCTFPGGLGSTDNDHLWSKNMLSICLSVMQTWHAVRDRCNMMIDGRQMDRFVRIWEEQAFNRNGKAQDNNAIFIKPTLPKGSLCCSSRALLCSLGPPTTGAFRKLTDSMTHHFWGQAAQTCFQVF